MEMGCAPRSRSCAERRMGAELPKEDPVGVPFDEIFLLRLILSFQTGLDAESKAPGSPVPPPPLKRESLEKEYSPITLPGFRGEYWSGGGPASLPKIARCGPVPNVPRGEPRGVMISAGCSYVPGPGPPRNLAAYMDAGRTGGTGCAAAILFHCYSLGVARAV